MKYGEEARELVIGREYRDFKNCPNVPSFVIEPCVGGMLSGIQMKWRVRYSERDKDEKVLVVMTGLAFTIADRKFIIQHSEKVILGKLLEGYAVYLIL